jgi:ribonuclease E
MKRMLFNATHQEELRVAIVDGQKLVDLDIETAGREQRKGNIYKAVITRIEPGLEACFINYGEDRHGFLPFKEVARSYFKEGVDVRAARVQDALHEGQELVVQVEKEERGNKGAALTTFISLAGRYLVLMPNNPRGGGVSRRIEGEDRQELREAMDQLNLPQGMSIIARTAGIGRNAEELQWDLSYLQQLWHAIDGAATENKAPILIYLESSLVIRAIRDYFSPDIGEILIDTDDIADQASAFMSVVMPDNVQRVKRYSDDVPLFSRFQIEHQIETAYSRHVNLPSGGSIVIDHTEALVAIDVNSARSTRGADIEETATRTNLEAAEEVARQLRLRDLGGLIVIDFIDMEDSKNQRAVENRLCDALHVDRARVQMGKISRFGLMELSRQRLRPALNEGSHITCPRCNGTGVVRDAESSALNILRLLQEEAMKENTAAVHAQVPVEVATFLLNEKRADITKIEARLKVNLILIPNKHIETPHHVIERLKHDDPRLEDIKSSFERVEAPSTDLAWAPKEEVQRVKPEALVKGVTPSQPAPSSTPKQTVVVETAQPSLFKRLFGWLFGDSTDSTPVVAAPEVPTTRQSSGSNRNDRSGQRNSRNNSNRNRRNDQKPAHSTTAVTSVTATNVATATLPSAQTEEVRQSSNTNPVLTTTSEAPVAEETQSRNSRNRRGRSRTRKEETTTETVAQPLLSAETIDPVVPTHDNATPASLNQTVEDDKGVNQSEEIEGVEGAEATDSDRPRRRGRRGRRGRRTGDNVNQQTDDQADGSSSDADTENTNHELFSTEPSVAITSSSSAPVTEPAIAATSLEQVQTTRVVEPAVAVSVTPAVVVPVEPAVAVPVEAIAPVMASVAVETNLAAPVAVTSIAVETTAATAEVTPTVPTQPVQVESTTSAAIPTSTASASIDHDVVIQTIQEQFAQDAAAPTQPLTVVTAKPIDREALHSVVNSVGLKWVESNPDNVVTAQAAAQMAPTAPRYGREPKAAPAVATIELKQVETQSS